MILNLFRAQDGTVPFWDDPSVHGGIHRPSNYQPRTTMISVMSDFTHGRFNKDDDLLLCLLRDAIAINENQLRRLLRNRLTSSRVSDRLRAMRIFGLTDKWFLRSREEDSEQEGEMIPPPSPWSVGLGGFLYLKHMYPDFVMLPDKLVGQGVKGVQRFVAANEIRTQLYEYQALSNWRWYPPILKNPKLGKPLAVGTMKGPQGQFHLVIERLLQSQNYLSFIINRLSNWNAVFAEYKYLPITDLPPLPSVVVLSVATDSMAEHIASKIPPGGQIPIWFITDERLSKQKLPGSVLIPTEKGLLSAPLNFLQARNET